MTIEGSFTHETMKTSREKLFLSLFGGLLEGVLILDDDSRVLYLNEPGAAILDASYRAVKGRRLQDFKLRCLRADGSDYPYFDSPPVVAARTRCVVSGAVMGVERKGRIRWLRINATPLPPGSLHQAAVIVSFLDISDLMDVQAQLATREAKFAAIFNKTFQFIGLLEPDGRMLEANLTALSAVGVTEEEVHGKFFWDTPWWAHSAIEQDKLKDGVRRAATGQFIRFETSHPAPEGLRWIDFSLSPVHGEDGSIRWLIPEGRDITDRKNGEIALMEAKADAESASQSKSQFLATMSHELRTPLNAILGYSEMMRDQSFGPLAADYLSYAGHIHEAGQRLLAVIQEILEIARIDTGDIDLEIEAIDLAALADKLRELTSHYTAAKRLDFTISLPPQRHPFQADRRRMIQLLLSLLLNATKFTKPGGRIGLEISQPEGATRFDIWDNGQGIAAEMLPYIWEPFSRAASAYVRLPGEEAAGSGLGLGLTLARHLVEAQRGTITVDSQLGEGSRFTMVFPAA